MLSVAKMPSASYFAERNGQLYYLKKGELPGVWFGRGAERLGLSGTVREGDFTKLRDGFAPDGTKLVRNAGEKSRFAGHDATLSAPKGLSVVWATHCDSKRRTEIEHAVIESAKEALSKFEATALYTRRGKGGAIVERAVGLAAALFLQKTSRGNDPQLHVHCPLFNALLCRDGQFRTMLGITARHGEAHRQSQSALYQMKMMLGAAFQDALARRVEGLGYRVERTADGFNVLGVPEDLIERFSSRSRDLRNAMKARGATGARAAAKAALETRPRKSDTPAEELFPRWQEEAKGFDPATLRGPMPARLEHPRAGVQAQTRLEDVVAKVHARVVAAPVLRQRSGINSEQRDRVEVRESAKPRDRGPAGEKSGGTDDERLLRASALAAKMLRRSRKDGSHVLAPLNVLLAAKQAQFIHRTTFTPEDRASLAAVTRKRGAVQLLSAQSGRRLDSVLAAAHLAWKREGYKTLLVTHSRADADEAEKRTGIHSITAIGLMKGLTTNRGLVRGYLSAQRKALSVGGFGKKSSFITYAFKASGKWLHLDEKTVVVVRSPDSLALPEFADLMKRAHKAGAKLVFVDEQGPSASPREAAADVSELLLRSHLGRTVRETPRKRELEEERSH